MIDAMVKMISWLRTKRVSISHHLPPAVPAIQLPPAVPAIQAVPQEPPPGAGAAAKTKPRQRTGPRRSAIAAAPAQVRTAVWPAAAEPSAAPVRTSATSAGLVLPRVRVERQSAAAQRRP